MSALTKTVTIPEKDFNEIIFHLNHHLSNIDGKIRNLNLAVNVVPPQFKADVHNDLKRANNTYIEVIEIINRLKELTR